MESKLDAAVREPVQASQALQVVAGDQAQVPGKALEMRGVGQVQLAKSRAEIEAMVNQSDSSVWCEIDQFKWSY